jgi:hypothetical protein
VDDTVAALEIAAARAIITGLERRGNRVGVLSYSERGQIRAQVGSAAAAQDALDDLRPSSGAEGTDVYAALRRARDMLEDAPKLPGFPPQRAVLLFTDGRPVEPVNPYIARRRAQQAADDLAQAGIDLYVFTFGSIGVEQAKFLVELAGSGEGRLHRVGAPERMLADLPSIDLTPVWLRIENASTGKSAEGIETRSNGHFSGFVPLEPGENELRVLVERGDGQLQRWVGTVVLAPDAADGDPGSRQAAIERVQREIEQRTRRPDAAAGPPPPEPR